MPSQVTHAYFVNDVYNKLNDYCKNKIPSDLKILRTFALGPDPLYFYNMFLGKKYKNIDKLGHEMHNKNTKEYFLSLINYIIKNNLQNNQNVIAYLYGSISHYYLDKTTHPFIFYKTGNFDKNNKDTYKYNALHLEMEYYIDTYFIHMKEKIDSNKFKFYKNIFNLNNFDKELTKMIDDVIYDVYNVSNIFKLYLKAIKDMYTFCKLFNYDKYGIKKFIFRTMDNIQPKKWIKKEELSYNINYKSKIHYLNLEKREWNHPFYQHEIYNYSFIELYIIAIKNCVNCIYDITKMIDNGIINNEIMNKYFNNSSYLTGKDCNLELKMKYFEF